MAYTPQYLDSLNAVPVQVPDDYSSSEKSDAVRLAEAEIELDLNDGRGLRDVTPVHEEAIKQRATAELVKGAEHPDDTALGDLSDSGSTKSRYSRDSFLSVYKTLVDKINAHMDTDQTGPFVYNTEPSKDWQELQDWFKQTDIDISNDFARRDGW